MIKLKNIITENFKVKGSFDMKELQDRLVEIKFEKYGIGYSWTDKFGKEKYEEGSFADAKSFDEILKRISEEILYQENTLGFDSGANRDPKTGNLISPNTDQNNNGYPDSSEGSTNNEFT